MTEIVEPILAAAALVVALGVLHRAGLGVYRTVRRIEDTFDLVHHELQPNSGGSLRDAIDRIEGKADAALHRIDALEQPVATAIVVNASPEPAG